MSNISPLGSPKPLGLGSLFFLIISSTLSSHTSQWKCIWHVAHCFTFLEAILVGFYNHSIILVRLSRWVRSWLLTPFPHATYNPFLPPILTYPPNGNYRFRISICPFPDVPGQLQANKPSGTFQGLLGPKYVTFLILSVFQRVLILNYSSGPENKRGVDGAWCKRGVRG